MIDLLCVGQLAVDILVRPVDCLDFAEDTRRVELIELKNGGDCLNVATGVSKLGCGVGFVGKIGEDHWGDFLAAAMDRIGIDRRGLKRTAEAGTCSVVVLINSEGERVFFYHGGTNDLLSLEDVDLSLVEEAEAVHVGGTYLLPRFDGEGAAMLFAEARSKGKLTSMDVTWDTRGLWLKTIERCLPNLSFFLPSYREAEKITKRSKPEDMASFLQEMGVQNVIVKLGRDGCYVKPEGEKGFFVGAFPTRVVDTTGAGDSFVAGFLAGVLRNWHLKKCATFANAVAALNIQQVGATAGIPTFDEACRFVEESSS